MEKVKIKFVWNTCYEGIDYGPDYQSDTVEVNKHEADMWIYEGRAVLVIETEPKKAKK